jgi:hypothetical protein
MPGMVEAHTHFAWNDAATLQDIQRMPTEEHTLWTAGVAKVYSTTGFTSAWVRPPPSRASTSSCATRSTRASSRPALLAAQPGDHRRGGLGDETLPHIPWPEFSFGVT